MSDTTVGRTNRDCSAEIQERELAQEAAASLVMDFAYHRSVRKEIARLSGASPETVKKWLAAESAPSLIFFLRLLPHSPRLQKMVDRIRGLEQDLSPDFARELNALIQRHMKA